ncbi:hypothetical protein D9M72_576760 [compost metagenome]
MPVGDWLGETGRIDEDVEPAEFLFDGAGEAAKGAGIRDVDGVARVAFRVCKGRKRRIRAQDALFARRMGDENRCACLRKQAPCRGADRTVPAD